MKQTESRPTSRELAGSPVSRLVMTHHHFDHILGCGGFGAAESYAAPPVAAALCDRLRDVRAEAVRHGADADEIDRAARAVHIARTTWCSRLTSTWRPGGRWEHREVATDHDLVVIVPGDPPVVFCGDLIEQSADPAIGPTVTWRTGRPHSTGCSNSAAPMRFVPGHGRSSAPGSSGPQRDWLAGQA